MDMHTALTGLRVRELARPAPAAPAVALHSEDPALDALKNAHRDYLAAVAAARDAEHAFEDHVDNDPHHGHERRVREAVAAGKKPPAPADPVVYQVEGEAILREAMRLRAEVKAAAAKVGAEVLAARDTIRPLLYTQATEAHNRAVQAAAEAKTADEAQRAALAALRALDVKTAEAAEGRSGANRILATFATHDQSDPSRWRAHALSQAWEDVANGVRGIAAVIAAAEADPLAE